MKNKKKVIITGAKGLFGKALLGVLKKDFELYPFSSQRSLNKDGFIYTQADVTDIEVIERVFEKIKPDIVIHAASLGNVDFCEKNQARAYAVNVKGTGNIIAACEALGAKIYFTSSNAVFDGIKAPYAENSKVSPVNYYGKTKVLAEELVRDSGLDYVIARLTLMYGWNNPTQRANPVTWLLGKLKNKESVKLVNDTYVNPILNTQAAEYFLKLLLLNVSGVFHVAGGERINRYDLGIKTAEIFGYDTSLIEAVDSDYFFGIAKRMPDTTYVTSKLEEITQISPLEIIDGLTKMKEENTTWQA